MVRWIAAWWRGWRYHWSHDTRPEPAKALDNGWHEREWLPPTPPYREDYALNHPAPGCRRVRTEGGMLLEYDWMGNYEVIETEFGQPLGSFLPAAPDWREQTMAELSPEALDLPQGPQAAASWGASPGPGGGASSLAPGPGAGLSVALPGPGVGDGIEWAVNAAIGPHTERPSGDSERFRTIANAWERERLADTGDIRDAGLLAEVTAYMRDQDADVADWLAGRAMTWARLEIGALT